MADYVPWLRELAERGGRGVVNNIDARSLGRIADEIERLTKERDAAQGTADDMYRRLTSALTTTEGR